MRYRHEQMIRARAQRNELRAEGQHAVEAALWVSLTAAEQRQWLRFSRAVGRVRAI
jgi:hypothetical protein